MHLAHRRNSLDAKPFARLRFTLDLLYLGISSLSLCILCTNSRSQAFEKRNLGVSGLLPGGPILMSFPPRLHSVKIWCLHASRNACRKIYGAPMTAFDWYSDSAKLALITNGLLLAVLIIPHSLPVSDGLLKGLAGFCVHGFFDCCHTTPSFVGR